jgi:cellulose synthase/poly-beta-1,6-N-acetylglucosamine synthase-like glycosyltransferase
MRHFIYFSNHALFFYYLAANIIYLALLIIAIVSSTTHQRRLASRRIERIKTSPLTPPISVVIPAHNEQQCIVASVFSILRLDYPNLEVVVVNDGSTDRTLDELTKHFGLRRTSVLYIADVPSAPVRGIYLSSVEQRLIVVDKEPGGSKADANNAGVNAATSPYVCVLDADAVLERDALLRMMLVILSDPERIVAAGGIVRAVNGCSVRDGELREVRLPRHPLEIIQVVEYLRAFLLGREAWARINMLPNISGAFGLFRRDLLKRVGGYRPAAIGEDFDLVTRLHRHMLEQKADYHIDFVPDPVCWTEVPSDLRSLGRQRARWQKGLLDALRLNKDMLFQRRYGRIGMISLPYQWMFELLAPIFEVIGLATIALAAIYGVLNHALFVQFVIYGYAFATLISIGSVLLEEITFRRYNRAGDVAILVLYCFLEHFPYRQVHLIWRLQGIWQYFRGDLDWKPLKRVGFSAPRLPGKTNVPQL